MNKNIKFITFYYLKYFLFKLLLLSVNICWEKKNYKSLPTQELNVINIISRTYLLLGSITLPN